MKYTRSGSNPILSDKDSLRQPFWIFCLIQKPTKLQSENNLAIAYRSKGDLKKALEIYNEMVEESKILSKNPSFHSLVIVNSYYFC